jgi:hypothetical protein
VNWKAPPLHLPGVEPRAGAYPTRPPRSGTPSPRKSSRSLIPIQQKHTIEGLVMGDA